MIFALILHHGQVQIERGFNMNARLLVENLTAPSILQQRRVSTFQSPKTHLMALKSKTSVV